MEEIYLKPLYIISVLMFVISLVLIPFSTKWSILVIIALTILWTRVPGAINVFLQTLAIYPMMVFIISATIGRGTGILFLMIAMWGTRFFRPEEWVPYNIRATVSGLVAIALVPTIIGLAGGINVMAFFFYLLIDYIVYYLEVFVLFNEEIPLELAILPSGILFEFVLGIAFFKAFGGQLSSLLLNGIQSGWPYLIFTLLILGLIALSLSAGKIGRFLSEKWDALLGRKEGEVEKIEEKVHSEKENSGSRKDDYSRFAEFFEKNGKSERK